jgi:catechol 2,3-dioxygenase-like lactoylglutathione lyase family enzyme
MSLRRSAVLYTFLDVHDLPGERELLESVVGLPVIEIEPHLPHHRHGAVKYDAGDVIVSLNLSSPGKFRDETSDALVTVVLVDWSRGVQQRVRGFGAAERRADGTLFTDASGHHYLFRTADPASVEPVVHELWLAVDDIDESVRFYEDALDLELIRRVPGAARFATGSVDLVLEQRERAVDGRALRRQTCLLVFHTADIEETHDALTDRGVGFGNKRPAFSEIGSTSRFDDPSGNRWCLYQPSEECLAWESGPTVVDIVAGRALAH